MKNELICNMDDVAIRVENISKKYRLGTGKSGSFRESLTNKFSLLKKNKKIEQDNMFYALDDVSFEINRGGKSVV